MSGAWKRWQDWVSVVVGALLFISPFALGAAAGMTAAAWTAYVGGVLLFVGGLWNPSSPENQSIEWAELVVGVLVFIAPWVLGFASLGPIAYAAWAAGVLAVLLSASVLFATRGRPTLAAQH